MLAKRGAKAFSQVRYMATEAGAGDAPASNGKMENLLEKLASITSNGPAGTPKETMLGKQKGKNTRNNRKPNNANNQRRKVAEGSPATLHTGEAAVFDFFYSRAVHKAAKYDWKADKFAQFEDTPEVYRAAEVSKPDLELSKDKMGYDTKSRVLRALEQITTKRGFKLSDIEKKNDSYLPYTALLYPYANTTLPNNLERPRANLKNLASVPEEEISATIASVVRGQRPELVYNPQENFKTEQLKINAQVVVNSLNRNAQLQVDNLHKSMAKVMLGQQPIKTLPQPVFPPKKL
ncbi:hypothetical protein PMKS-002319 [Pichia membranifaciens]|uniref:Uncharacterized protein n=1 Tax=Pichia membranifaciens TaxID=4926 RepID=A0A1Q2YH35_9ASCO|nr:hypothetical protein PMKS-002319 [Pichia membranifaciens]